MSRIIACNIHNIDARKENGATTGREMNKHNMIMNTLNEASNKNNRSEFLKPGMRGMLETTDDSLKVANMLRRLRKFLWRLNIDFLMCP